MILYLLVCYLSN